MARKNLATPTRVSVAHSLATSFTGPAMDVSYLDNVWITADCTGVTDNTGSFSVEVRNVPAEGKGAPSNWGSLTLDTTPNLSNMDEVIQINLNQVPFSQFRLVFTANGVVPDGVADIWYTARQVGG
jgi:hypothetical protein